MKKINTITFHASYNYGSNLQAYALQEYIKNLDDNIDYSIINLRIPFQKEMYAFYKKPKTISACLRNISNFINGKKIREKNIKFEKFINEKLNVTKEYNSLEELNNVDFQADYYISGSDQVWNLRAGDFDWANYLEFVNKGKKISYAASFGPKPQTWNNETKQRVKEDLLKYDNISVREIGSYNNVYELTGIKPDINVDPTMLLTKEQWKKLYGEKPYYNGKYILFYTLSPSKEMMKLVKKVSNILKIPVVITKYNNKYDIINTFEKVYEAGPIEFLNLIDNAELVLSSSFHGTVFSVLFNKPFFAINGDKDFRISTLLQKMNLKERTINFDNIEEKCEMAFEVNFEESKKLLDIERMKSKQYLIKALDINNE